MTFFSPFSSPESPTKFVLGTATRGHVNGEQKLFEVYVTVSIFVKVSKNVITEFFCVRRQEARAVDVHEGLGRQPAVGAILLEAAVPGHDGLNTVVGVF